MKIKITETHASQIDELVTNSKPGELLEFGDIGLIVFGKKGAGGIVGGYIFDNRHRLPGWWRVVNWSGHPVADVNAITYLSSEGHQLRNGSIIGYRRNPQANIMRTNGILDSTINAVDNILRSNRANTFSSNQLMQALPLSLQSSLSTIAGAYNDCACSDPASYVGTAASMLSKRNPASVIHDTHFWCPILKRYDDAFRLA